jgi:hypothetical protein
VASREEEEQGSRGFKVQDRRRFVDNPDAANESDPQPADTARSAPPPEPPRTDLPPPPPPSDAPAGHPHDAAGVGELNFSTFVMGLTTQALMHLGEIPDPMDQAVARDLPAAKQMIDLLGILREKTRGNLDAAEAQLLDSMLYDLRMRFVEVSRGG